MIYILEYDEQEKGCPLEDMLCRTFVVDKEQFGEKKLFELKPGGAEIMVTKENRKEFVQLLVDFEFRKQCE